MIRFALYRIMTKLERLKQQLEKAREDKALAIRRNDFNWMSLAANKMARIEREIAEAEKYEPTKLKNILDSQDEDVKNRVYAALIKISLAADFVNECAEQANDVLRGLDIKEYSLRPDVKRLCELSQKIASFVIVPNQSALTDMLVDDDEFISTCDEAAEKHLKETLGL